MMHSLFAVLCLVLGVTAEGDWTVTFNNNAGCGNTCDKPTKYLTLAYQFATGTPLDATEFLVAAVEEKSHGRLKIKKQEAPIAAPDAYAQVKAGTTDLAYAIPNSFGTGQTARLFHNAPFGPGPTDMAMWFKYGGGMELMKAHFGRDGVMPFIGGDAGREVLGWFDRELTSLASFNGITFRGGAFATDVFEFQNQLGMDVIAESPANLAARITEGSLNAAEFLAPYPDTFFGIPDAARAAGWYLTLPGIIEPAAVFIYVMNQNSYAHLTAEEQGWLKAAFAKASHDYTQWFLHENIKEIAKWTLLYNGEACNNRPMCTKVSVIPDSVTDQLKTISDNALDAIAAGDSEFATVLASMRAFMANGGAAAWDEMLEPHQNFA